MRAAAALPTAQPCSAGEGGAAQWSGRGSAVQQQAGTQLTTLHTVTLNMCREAIRGTQRKLIEKATARPSAPALLTRPVEPCTDLPSGR